MRPLDPPCEALFDNAGQHLGGIYPPLIADGALTSAHADFVASRPASHLVWRDDAACPNPLATVGLVWMAPHVGGNPLEFSPGVLPFLVLALDA